MHGQVHAMTATFHPAGPAGSPSGGALSEPSQAEARLRALLAATSDVVYRMNADGSEMQPLDGQGFVAGSDAPLQDWLERSAPESEHAIIRATIARAVATRSVYELEHRVHAPDGSLRWMHSRAVPVFDAAGAIVEWIGAARDVTERRAAAAALQDSEQRFRSVFEQSTGGIAQVDLRGRFVLVNDRYCEIVGRPREELLTMSMQDLTHPDDVGGNLAAFTELAQGRCKSFTIEKRYLRPDGTSVWVQNAVSATLAADGEPRYITAVVADITGLRDGQGRQETLAAQRQLALDAARLGWWQYTPATGTVEHDARYAEIYGLAGSGPRSIDDINALLHPDDAPALWAAVHAAVNPVDPQPYSAEYRINRADGSVRWLEARGVPTFAGEGDRRVIEAFAGTVADVTERRLADEVLRRNEARFRLMADASPAVLWLTDPEGYCTFLSREWYAMTGQTQEEALGLGWTLATHPDDQAQAGSAFLAANAGRTFFSTEYRLRAADGSYRWAIDLGRPWFSETGEYAGMVGAVFDIDARKRAEDALGDASRRKDDFLAMLAHELRNPLAPIRNASEVLRMLHPDDPRLNSATAVIGRQVDHLAALLDDLLDVARVTRGAVVLERAVVPVADIVSDAVEQAQHLVEARGHRLDIGDGAAAAHVFGDRKRLTQVLTNLLVNAAKYSPHGSDIRLAFDLADERVAISVIDTGAGLQPDMVERIFELFVQGERTSDRHGGGLGVGLALVRSLVEMHGGTVRASSPGPGAGSVFTVELPRAAAPVADAAPVRAATERAVGAGALRLMVVDDNEDAAQTLALFLRGMGHHVVTETDPRIALARAAALDPDAFVLDIGMPHMDGFELARRLRELSWARRPTLIALTGYGADADRQRAYEAGFDHHVVKPLDPGALVELLEIESSTTRGLLSGSGA